MSTHTLKSVAHRGSMLSAVVAIVVAAVLPAASAFADELNPLTERSLLLSSSAPGFQDQDGSGNSESNPNAYNGGEYYAPPGSGPNGKKSGETFTFRVSTDSSTATGTGEPIKSFTLQYCTSAAGNCQAPGNNSGDNRTPDRMSNDDAFALPTPTSDFDVVTDGTTPWTQGSGPGQYQILIGGQPSSAVWTMSTKNAEDDAHSGALTGKNNLIILSSLTGDAPVFNDKIEIKFTPNTKNYITNPGTGSFFVKINTYKTEGGANGANVMPTTNANIIDGGVTVANVMTDSIHITTKVLETMAFSVGTQNPDTQPVQHGSCQSMDVVNGNRLSLGNPDAEYSLETGKAWDVNSYWRLSSNSSGGATVYYSGDTLRNTVGDFIQDMPAKAHSQPGTEQFGLALIDAGRDTFDTATGPDTGDVDQDGDTSEILPLRPFPTNWITPDIYPLVVEAPYADGGYDPNGAHPLLPISNGVGPGNGATADNAQFAFKKTSQMIPEILAQENTAVISCATAKMRYVGNIAADTPAGVYTTKINYLAAPQY